jgi:hypothetical protein
MGALLKLEKDNRFLLVRSLHRRELFGPLGGVFKHEPGADAYLRSIGFVAESRQEGRQGDGSQREDIDLHEDLRGYLPAMNLAKFLDWFKSGRSREDSVACLQRELREELVQACADQELIDLVKSYTFKQIRLVNEERVLTIWGYELVRQFEIFEPDYESVADGERNRAITNRLFEMADADHPDLIAVDKLAIEVLRGAGGQPLAVTVEYFFGDTKRNHEPLPFGRHGYSSAIERQLQGLLRDGLPPEIISTGGSVRNYVVLHAVRKYHSDSITARVIMEKKEYVIKYYSESNLYVQKEEWALNELAKHRVRVPELVCANKTVPAFTILRYVNGDRLDTAPGDIRDHINSVIEQIARFRDVLLPTELYGEIIGQFLPGGNHSTLDGYVRSYCRYWTAEIEKRQEDATALAHRSAIEQFVRWGRAVEAGTTSVTSALSSRPCLCHSDLKLEDVILEHHGGRAQYCLLDFDNVFALVPEFDLCRFHFNLSENRLSLELPQFAEVVARHYKIDASDALTSLTGFYPFVLLRLLHWGVKRNDDMLLGRIEAVVDRFVKGQS